MKLIFKFILALFTGFCICCNSIVLAQDESIIEIQGQSVNVFTAGWDHLKNGVPTVVFDGGSTVPIKAWGKVLTEIAQNAPVVAFDPPGIGKSEWNGQRPTLSNMNERLHSILEAINAKPPYILVGHSWAGWLVQGFAGRYPDEVAGLVLIDPTPSVEEFLSAFKEIGVGGSGLKELSEMTMKMMATAPPPFKARQSVIAEFHNTHTDPKVPRVPTVPVAVLVAGHYGDASVPDSLKPSFDMNKFFEVLRRRQISAPIEWVRKSSRGFFVLANDSGHCLHCEDPDLVAWAINRVLFPDRDNK